jgi:putative isomerase
MMSNALSQSRHWSTWDAARPAEFSHLPSDLRITPVVYAASIRKAADFPPGPSIAYGAHALDAGFVDLKLSHAGTKLHWSYLKPDPMTVVGSWETEVLGEWGLRVWVTVCFSTPASSLWHFDAEQEILWSSWADGCFVVACLKPPLLVTSHSGVAALQQEFEERGYWYLASRAIEGPFMALRFNLEEMPSNRFAVAYAETLAAASRKAKQALAAAAPSSRPSPRDALAAARDILGWNTVWDPKNMRPYTACSRNWDMEKFGGFGVWLADAAVSALVHSLFGEEQARENLQALLAGQTPAGNFPCLLTGNDAWVDRSQPPIVSLIVWLIYCRTGSRQLLETAYDALVRNHHWWWRARDGNGNGVLEYGSSDLGNGLYVGTRLAAKNESFMDNSPVHDEAQWNEQSRTLDCEDVGLNSLIALDAEMLGRLAFALGSHGEAKAHHARAEAHSVLVSDHFWDRSRGIFANRLWNGNFVRSVSPASFFPLLIKAATPRQIDSLLRHLSNRRSFGGRWGLPSVARNDRAFADNVYWRGRIWPILNWLVWLGLKRNGLSLAADDLQNKSRNLFAASWGLRLAPENFNATTGRGLDQPDTDPFYSWTALLPMMSLADVMDIDPWDGWCLKTIGEEIDVGPINSPIGAVHLTRRRGWIELRRAGAVMLATNIRPGISQLVLGERLSLMLPSGLTGGSKLRTLKSIVSAVQDGRSLPVKKNREIVLRKTGVRTERLEIQFK